MSDDPVPTRSDRKRRSIVEAATAAFLHSGYLGTSMDEIAAAAAVSKQTVYKHFADKETLFLEVVRAMVGAVSDPVHGAVRALEPSGDVEADLRVLARRQLELVLQPRLMRLRRLVIAEAARFPELGRAFYEQGPARTIEVLADTIGRLAADGQLVVADLWRAATELNWLVMAEPLNRAMFLGFDAPPAPAELDSWAADAVATFVAAYRA